MKLVVAFLLTAVAFAGAALYAFTWRQHGDPFAEPWGEI